MMSDSRLICERGRVVGAVSIRNKVAASIVSVDIRRAFRIGNACDSAVRVPDKGDALARRVGNAVRRDGQRVVIRIPDRLRPPPWLTMNFVPSGTVYLNCARSKIQLISLCNFP